IPNRIKHMSIRILKRVGERKRIVQKRVSNSRRNPEPRHPGDMRDTVAKNTPPKRKGQTLIVNLVFVPVFPPALPLPQHRFYQMLSVLLYSQTHSDIRPLSSSRQSSDADGKYKANSGFVVCIPVTMRQKGILCQNNTMCRDRVGGDGMNASDNEAVILQNSASGFGGGNRIRSAAPVWTDDSGCSLRYN
ncbi:hypothetical protein CBL_21192, partial [Carabus blaptoides fortunei]